MAHVLLVSGSVRDGSVNAATLATVAVLAGEDVTTATFDGLARLPHFNPDLDRDPLPAEVATLRAAIGASDAVLFCTPEYAGALPGSFKNLLDWTVGGGEMYEQRVGFVNVSTRTAADAHASLRIVLGYLGADLVEGAAVHIPVPRAAIGPDGLIADPELRDRLRAVLAALTGPNP